jgi:protein-disulfide isomerase
MERFQNKNLIYTSVLIGLVISLGTYIYFAHIHASSTLAEEIANRETLEKELLSEHPYDFTIGATDPSLKIIVYADTDCPFCAEFENVIGQVQEKFANEIAITYRTYKLPIYPFSVYEHQALECIGMLEGAGQYQQFQKQVLFPLQLGDTESAKSTLFDLAQTYITPEKSEALRSCLDDPDTTERTSYKTNTGNILGVRKTPTWFIVSDTAIQQYVGAFEYERVLEILNSVGLK